MNRRLSIAVSFALLMLVPVLLSAQMGGMRGECGHGYKGLDLDQEQQTKMEKLKLEHKLAGVDMRAEQAKLRLQMKEEMMKDEPSRKALEKYSKGMAVNREKMQMMRIDHMLDVRKILNPEQWKIFARHHYDREGRMGERGHRCHERMMDKHKRGERGCRAMPHRDGSCRGERPHEGKIAE